MQEWKRISAGVHQETVTRAGTLERNAKRQDEDITTQNVTDLVANRGVEQQHFTECPSFGHFSLPTSSMLKRALSWRCISFWRVSLRAQDLEPFSVSSQEVDVNQDFDDPHARACCRHSSQHDEEIHNRQMSKASHTGQHMDHFSRRSNGKCKDNMFTHFFLFATRVAG